MVIPGWQFRGWQLKMSPIQSAGNSSVRNPKVDNQCGLLQERSKIATFGPFRAEILCYNQGLPMTAAWVVCVGEWLSLVEHLVRDQGVGGSNPLSPTNLFNNLHAI